MISLLQFMIPIESLQRTAICSTVEKSFLKEEADVRVLDKCPPEELHEMMEIVNHTWNGYIQVVGCRKQAFKFPKRLAKEYPGVQFEGKAW